MGGRGEGGAVLWVETVPTLGVVASWGSLGLMSIETVIPSNHLIL